MNTHAVQFATVGRLLAGSRYLFLLLCVLGVTGAVLTLAGRLGDGTGRATIAGLFVCIVGLAYVQCKRASTRQGEFESVVAETGAVRAQLAAAQAELAQKEQLAMVGELAAVIAHEVRNPLAVIGNAIASLRKEAISRDDHDTLLCILDEEANRLNHLVTDLLRYARPVNVQRTCFCVRDLLERAVGHVRSSRPNIAATLTIEGPEGRMWGDANLLRQVFDNLVENASQAMDDGGALTVRVRGANEDGVDGFAIDIVDTGEGMDTYVRSRARDPFFTTRPSGTGLGLAIVDRIVMAHEGRFSIESRSGEGTTVTVFLPLGSSSEPPPPKRAPALAAVGIGVELR